jgi:hypothetical protein
MGLLLFFRSLVTDPADNYIVLELIVSKRRFTTELRLDVHLQLP